MLPVLTCVDIWNEETDLMSMDAKLDLIVRTLELIEIHLELINAKLNMISSSLGLPVDDDE